MARQVSRNSNHRVLIWNHCFVLFCKSYHSLVTLVLFSCTFLRNNSILGEDKFSFEVVGFGETKFSSKGYLSNKSSALQTSVLMQRLSYATETVSSNKIARNGIVTSFKDSPRKPLGRRPSLQSSSLPSLVSPLSDHSSLNPSPGST